MNQEEYKILETIFHLMWDKCNKEKRMPTLEEIRKLLEAIEICLNSSIKKD